jgi:hypothetical protein
MKLRGLLGTVLLLAIPAMAQPDTVQAASEPPVASAQPVSAPPATLQLAASVDATAPEAQPTPAALTSLQVDCTPASRASELTGKHGCVAGRVFRISTTKHGDMHLSLCPSRNHGGANCSFRVIAPARDSSSVGDLAYLRGKIIAVVGDVTEYRGHPEIIVRDKEQVQVAADEALPDFDAGQRRPGGRGIPGARGIPGVRNIPGVGNGRAW